MPEPRSVVKRRGGSASSERAVAVLSCVFWTLSLGGIVLFGWLAAVGNLHPSHVGGLTGGVAALTGLWATYGRVQRRRGFDISRHPDVVRERERRNF